MDQGEELVAQVKQRYGRLQATDVCSCGACLAAGVDEPPVLVPLRKERDAQGAWHDVGRWAHGYELRKLIDARRKLKEQIAALLQRR